MLRKIDRTGYLRATLGALVVSSVYLATIVALLAPVAQVMYPGT